MKRLQQLLLTWTRTKAQMHDDSVPMPLQRHWVSVFNPYSKSSITPPLLGSISIINPLFCCNWYYGFLLFMLFYFSYCSPTAKLYFGVCFPSRIFLLDLHAVVEAKWDMAIQSHGLWSLMHKPYWTLRAAPPLPPLIRGPSHLIILFFIICMYSAFAHLFPRGIFRPQRIIPGDGGGIEASLFPQSEKIMVWGMLIIARSGQPLSSSIPGLYPHS